MRSKTRIVVLHMKEVIYTTIFIILGIVLIFLLVYMFGPSRHNKTDTGPGTKPVYTRLPFSLRDRIWMFR